MDNDLIILLCGAKQTIISMQEKRKLEKQASEERVKRNTPVQKRATNEQFAFFCKRASDNSSELKEYVSSVIAKDFYDIKKYYVAGDRTETITHIFCFFLPDAVKKMKANPNLESSDKILLEQIAKAGINDSMINRCIAYNKNEQNTSKIVFVKIPSSGDEFVPALFDFEYFADMKIRCNTIYNGYLYLEASLNSFESFVNKVMSNDIDGVSFSDDFLKKTRLRYTELRKRETAVKNFREQSRQNARLMARKVCESIIDGYDHDSLIPDNKDIINCIPCVYTEEDMKSTINSDELKSLFETLEDVGGSVYNNFCVIQLKFGELTASIPLLLSDLELVLREIHSTYSLNNEKNMIIVKTNPIQFEDLVTSLDDSIKHEL